jgi:hypothetical protein
LFRDDNECNAFAISVGLIDTFSSTCKGLVRWFTPMTTTDIQCLRYALTAREEVVVAWM